MEANKLIPYSDYLCLEPVERKQVLVAETGNLQTFGKVIAVGKEVVDTVVGDYVAFELWDLRDFTVNDKKYYFVKEQEAICKIPVSEFLPS